MDQYYKLPTNIKSLDELTNGGIILNGINVISAGCGNGKSILSTMIGVNQYKSGYNVLFINIQDSEYFQTSIIYHILSNVKMNDDLDMNGISVVDKIFEKNSNGGSIIVKSLSHRNVNINDLLKYINYVYNETKFDVLIIDDIESIIGYNKSNIIKLGEFIDNKNITTILPMQLNRNLINIASSNDYIILYILI